MWRAGDVLHDFIGATTTVDDSLWTGSHVYRLEWQPSHEGTGGGQAVRATLRLETASCPDCASCFQHLGAPSIPSNTRGVLLRAAAIVDKLLKLGMLLQGYVLWTLDGKTLARAFLTVTIQ